MGRAKTQRKRAVKTPSAEKINTSGSVPSEPTRRAGTERPDKFTNNPPDIADPQARVIKTNS